MRRIETLTDAGKETGAEGRGQGLKQRPAPIPISLTASRMNQSAPIPVKREKQWYQEKA